MDTHDLYLIDKARVRSSFSRAADTYDDSAVLQKEVRQRMFNRLDLMKITPGVIIDAGSGTGQAGRMLASRFPGSRLLQLDSALGMLQKGSSKRSIIGSIRKLLGRQSSLPVCGDMEGLPLAGNSVGLIWSNLAIQWCNELDNVFQEAHRVLEPGGLFMFSSFGPDTLKELREAAAADPDHVHVSRFIDMHDIGDALIRAGFTAPVLDVEHFVLTYDDVITVMRDLKAIGAHNAATGRRRGLEGKGFLKELTARYENFRQQGKLPATFEVVYGHAWKPVATAPQDGVATITLHRKKPPTA